MLNVYETISFAPDETFLLMSQFFSSVVIFERFNYNLVHSSLISILRSNFWFKQRGDENYEKKGTHLPSGNIISRFYKALVKSRRGSACY